MPTVQLDWDYVQGTDPAVRFRVERRVGTTGAWGLLGEVQPVGPGSATYSYEDATVAEGQSYGWRVSALNAGGSTSSPSNIFSLAVPGVLNPPTNLRGALI